MASNTCGKPESTQHEDAKRVPDATNDTIMPADNESGHDDEAEKSGSFERYIHAGLNHEDARFLSSHSPKDESRIYRKVDYRYGCFSLVPFYIC